MSSENDGDFPRFLIQSTLKRVHLSSEQGTLGFSLAFWSMWNLKLNFHRFVGFDILIMLSLDKSTISILKFIMSVLLIEYRRIISLRHIHVAKLCQVHDHFSLW